MLECMRQEIGTKKANCIAVHKSKGEKVSVRKTYANLESIKKRQELDLEKTSNELTKKKKNIKKSIVLEDDSVLEGTESEEEVDREYVQYEIEYAPKKDVLKYGAEKYNNKNDFAHASRKTYENYSDEDEDYDISEEFSDLDDYLVEKESTYDISLDDLINNHLVAIIEKHEKRNKKFSNEPEEKLDDIKNRKIFIEKTKPVRQISHSKPAVQSKKFPKAVPIHLDIKNESIKSENLKLTYGLWYSEAYFCWPRHFSINLNEEIRSTLLRNYSKDCDIICWLTFQEIIKPQEDLEEKKDTSEYRVSLVCNLKVDYIFLENINTSETYEIQDIIKKAVDFVCLCLPFESFPETTRQNYSTKNRLSSTKNYQTLLV